MRITERSLAESGLTLHVEESTSKEGRVLYIEPERPMDMAHVRQIIEKEFGIEGPWADLMLEETHRMSMFSRLDRATK